MHKLYISSHLDNKRADCFFSSLYIDKTKPRIPSLWGGVMGGGGVICRWTHTKCYCVFSFLAALCDPTRQHTRKAFRMWWDWRRGRQSCPRYNPDTLQQVGERGTHTHTRTHTHTHTHTRTQKVRQRGRRPGQADKNRRRHEDKQRRLKRG